MWPARYAIFGGVLMCAERPHEPHPATVAQAADGLRRWQLGPRPSQTHGQPPRIDDQRGALVIFASVGAGWDEPTYPGPVSG
jgi:hypothetical protein